MLKVSLNPCMSLAHHLVLRPSGLTQNLVCLSVVGVMLEQALLSQGPDPQAHARGGNG